MVRTIVFTVALLSAGPAVAEFKIDVTPEQVRRATNAYQLIDLAVGERGVISYPGFCYRDDVLHLHGEARLLSERSDYGVNWIATRQPGGYVSLEVVMGSKSQDTPNSMILTVLAGLRDCGFVSVDPAKLIPVGDINGLTSSSSALEQRDR